MSAATAREAYRAITGRDSKLTRMPPHFGTLCYEDEERFLLCALFDFKGRLYAWEYRGNRYYSPDGKERA